MTAALSIVLSLAFGVPIYLLGPCPAANCVTMYVIPVLLIPSASSLSMVVPPNPAPTSVNPEMHPLVPEHLQLKRI